MPQLLIASHNQTLINSDKTKTRKNLDNLGEIGESVGPELNSLSATFGRRFDKIIELKSVSLRNATFVTTNGDSFPIQAAHIPELIG